MMKWMLAAGAAALAIAAPTAAERGGKGGEQGAEARKADRQNARAQRGGDRQLRADRGGTRERANRPTRGSDRVERRATRVERASERQASRATAPRSERQQRGRAAAAERQQARVDRQQNRVNREERRVERQQVRQDRAPARDRAQMEARRGNATRGDARAVVMDRRAERAERRADNRAVNGTRAAERLAVSRDPVFRVRDVDRRGNVRLRDVNRDQLFVRRLGFVDGCPPGLAKKANGCLPPGQAAKFIGQPLLAANRVTALEPLPSPFRSLYWDNDDYYYRYGGGYLYRVDRDDDLIAAMIPLFGAALLGQQLQPYYVNSYYRPSYYSSFYPNSPYDCYQYGYGYIYETDCATGLVEDVIPTYDYGYGVGQLLPASYGYYNVPFAYRSQFIDDDDYYYRYAPGAIYRVDRDTALISAVVALLSGGLSVGQPLPVGYNTYNVPLAYRSTYYDRPDIWYRYDNGYIYGVDPRTRMVQSVAYAII